MLLRVTKIKSYLLLFIAHALFLLLTEFAALLSLFANKFTLRFLECYSASLVCTAQHRYASNRIHRKSYFYHEQYSSGENEFLHEDQAVAHLTMQEFCEGYFLPSNLSQSKNRWYLYSDECSEVGPCWGAYEAHDNWRLVALATASSIIKLSSRYAWRITVLFTSSLLAALVLWLVQASAESILAVVATQTVLKSYLLSCHVGGVKRSYSEPIGPDLIKFPHYFPVWSDLYELRPLVLVELENFPHWCPRYLSSCSKEKKRIDSKLASNGCFYWEGIVSENDLSDSRDFFAGRTFTCPHGIEHKFLIERRYVNSALSFINFSLLPAIFGLNKSYPTFDD